MSKAYNYQNLSNRLKRDFWALICSFPYFFKKNKSDKHNAIAKLIGEYPKDFIAWIREDELVKKQRLLMYSLPGIKVYIVYFYKQFQEYKLDDNTYVVEFSNDFQGVKDYFRYMYNLNPKVIQVHDSLLVGFINFLIKKTMNSKMIFMPRGMNYYSDFVFRKKNSLGQFLRAHYNRIFYQYIISNSSFVNAPSMLALEAELASKMQVHVSDFLLCCGAIPVLTNSRKDVPSKLFEVQNRISKFDKKIFTFSRVEKYKISGVLDTYIKLEKELNNSCIVVIGDGSALSEYKNRFSSKNNIIFTGWLDKNEAFSFIRDFDLMIAPSGGYSLIEAGLLGIPTVAHNYDIMSDLIYNRFNGYLIDKKSEEELEEVLLEHFSKNKKDRELIRSRVSLSYRTRFNLEVLEQEKKKIVKKILDVSNEQN